MTIDHVLIGAALLFPAFAGLFFFLWRRGHSEPHPVVPEEERVEPTMSGTRPLPPKSAPPPPPAGTIQSADEFPGLPERLNDEIHYIVRLWQDRPRALDEEAFGRLVESLEEHCLNGYSLQAFEPQKGKWESPRLGVDYKCYLWNTALANRHGQLTPENVMAIEGHALRFAADNDLFVSMPKREEILANINLLDKFCAEVDQVLSVYLANMPGDRSQSSTVQQICELALAEGFVADSSGELAFYEENQRLFILRARNGGKLGEEPPARVLSGLKLEMDIPHLSEPAAAFDAMVQCANRLSRPLHFSVVDDRGVPISDSDFGAYRDQVVQIREKMDTYGVKAGSTIARTLFS